MKHRVALLGSLVFFVCPLAAVKAEPARFCVKCVDPNQTYVCQVETPQSGAPSNGLQLYCIVRTSKEGGHRSCAVDKTPISSCAGPVKSYGLVLPEVTPEMRATIERYRGQANSQASFANEPPPPVEEPETMIGATSDAAETSDGRLSSTRQAVGDAASRTGQTMGRAARGVGKATKKTGSAVGGAAKTAYDCLRTWFKECRSSDEAQ